MGLTGTVRVAMIGAGRMANNVHYPSLASFDDVEIAAICDVAQEPLNATADKYGVEKRYSDYRQMVAEIAPGGLITPAYFPDATASFRKALIVWSTNDQLNTQQRSDLLKQVLKEARLQDALTLVNLFRRANSEV